MKNTEHVCAERYKEAEEGTRKQDEEWLRELGLVSLEKRRLREIA